MTRMKNPLWLALLLFAAPLLISVGCTPPDDDDDDDDDDVTDDDDTTDDDDSEDETITPTAASISSLMTVTCGDDPPGDDDDSARGADDDDSAGDDDDSAGDDDDSGADDDDSGPADDDDSGPADDDDSGDPGPEPCLLQIDYIVRYWDNIETGSLACDQHLTAQGEVLHGFGNAPGCPSCSAAFSIDAETWEDASDPTADPNHCDPEVLDASGLAIGTDLVEGAADFNQGVFLSAGVHEAIGTDYGGGTAVEIATNYAENSLAYAGLIFWEATPGSAAAGLESAGLFEPEGDAGQFQPAFFVYYDPATNVDADPTSPDGWLGVHGASSTFFYNLEQ